MICGKKELEEEEEEACSQDIHTIESFQQQLLQQFPPFHSFNPLQFGLSPVHDEDPLLLPASQTPYSGLLFNTRSTPTLQFGYDIGPSSSSSDHHARIVSEAICQSRSVPFGFLAELDKISTREMIDAKALAASRKHSEAERSRRKRINNHLARLRSLLPNTTKTDKASLLTEVIQHVKELKRQTSQIAETSLVPAEFDELTVDTSEEENGNFIIKASLCCQDRSDLIPDLVKTLKALKLRTFKAEIITLGERVRNVLFVTAEEESNGSGVFCNQQKNNYYSMSSIQEAFKAVMVRKNGEECDTSGGVIKRHRTIVNTSMLEHRSV